MLQERCIDRMPDDGEGSAALAPVRFALWLPQEPMWAEFADGHARLGSPCTALLFPRNRPPRTESACDTSATSLERVAIPAVLMQRIAQALDLPPATAREGLPWNWVHIGAAQYLAWRRLQRQGVTEERAAMWLCDVLRANLVHWRRWAWQAGRNGRPIRQVRHPAAQWAAREIAARSKGGVPLQELAGRIGCSVFHLLRQFRTEHALTPHQFLLQLRLRRGLRLLEDSPLNGAGLARELGFSSHGHFCAAFRASFGCSPKAYQRWIETSPEEAPPAAFEAESLRPADAR